MIESWWPSTEQIMLAMLDSDVRVLGILSPDRGAGVSVLSRMVAEGFARSGKRTILADFSRSTEDVDERATWEPGGSAAKAIRKVNAGYDQLVAHAVPERRPAFNSVDAIRQLLAEDLSDYQIVIVDLPAVIPAQPDRLNPIAIARACDLVVMVCLGGKTTSARITAAVSALGTAGVQLGGAVLNDRHNTSLWSQTAG